MANLHDVSWGNRETDQKNAEETRKSLEQFRALYLIVWVALNSAYGYGIVYLSEGGETVYILILTVSILIAYFFIDNDLRKCDTKARCCNYILLL